MNRACQIFLTSLLIFLLHGVVALAAPETSSVQTRASISLDFKDIELRDLIKTISELTGRNFVYDERVRGKVTIISPEAMSKEEAYQLFLTVLNVKGFTLVPSGKANKIVPLQNARQNNLPVSEQEEGESYVTRLIRLKYADAQNLARTVLTPLIPKTSNLVAYPPSNTLILTDSAANIGRLLRIIESLDIPSSLARFEIFTLEHAYAEEVARIASSLLKQGKKGKQQGQPASEIIPYPRTNSLIVVASTEELGLLRDLIRSLDRPRIEERSNINVYTLKNADAEGLAKTLTEIIKVKPVAGKDQTTTRGPVTITADKPTNSLLVSAGPEDYELVRQVIEKLDVRRNQVYVEALILELSLDATRELGASLQGVVDIGGQKTILGTSNLNNSGIGDGGNGVNLSSLVPDPNIGNGQLPSVLAQSVQGMLLGGLFNPVTTVGPDGSTITVPAISALIQLSQTSDDINILSAPRLLTSDNEEAEIIVGSNVPVITNRLTDTGGSGGLATNVSVERKDVALTLRFTPQVTEGNLVRLNVYQEITDIASTSVGDVNQVGPTLTKRQLRNTVLAEDGKTVVLGGLIGTNISKKEFKVPLLGDIPLLGRLFRSTSTRSKKTNLLVFMTPRVIHDASEMAQLTRRERLTGQRFQTPALRKAVDQDALMTDIIAPDEEEASPQDE